MSETVQLKKNRLQTVITGGAPGTPAVGYQFRMGYVADADTQFQTATSSFVLSQKIGADAYGVQFDNYRSDSTAEVNYITTMGEKTKLNLFTISSVANGYKPVSMTNTDYVNADGISSGSIYARDVYTSNFNASNIVADSITARLINVQYVSSIQMSTNSIVGNDVSTTTLTFETGYGTGVLNQQTAIVQSLTSIANNLSNIYGSTMTFTNTANLNDLNVATVNTSNYINAPLANIVSISSGTLSYRLAYGENLSSQNVSTNTLGFVTANGTTLNLATSLTAPTVNAVTVSTGTTTFALAVGASVSTQSVSTNTLGFVSANGTTLNLATSLTAPTVNAVTVSSGTTTFALAVGASVSTQSVSTNTLGFVSANGSSLNLSNANISTYTFNNASGGSISTMRISTGTITTTSMTTSTLTTRTLDVYDINVASGINFANGGVVSALSEYNGMRVTDPDSGNELGFFLLTTIDSIDVKIATVDSTGSNQTPMLEYISTAAGTKVISYATNLSSLNGKISFGSDTLLGASISTIFLSSGQSAFGTSVTVNGTVQNLSTTNGTITNLAATNGTIQNLSTTNGTITNLAATNGTIQNLSTVSGTITTLAATNGTITTLAATNGTIQNLSTVSGTITTLAATNGTIQNLSTVSGTITTLAATNGTIQNLSTVSGTITNLAATNAAVTTYVGTDITLSNNFVGPYMSTVNLYAGNATLSYALVDELVASNITTTSDMRLKKNIMPLSNALTTLLQLEPVSYDWTTRGNMREGFQEIGFLAQAVEAVLPNIVAVRNDEMATLSVGYDRLTAVLTGAVKELAARVAALESRPM